MIPRHDSGLNRVDGADRRRSPRQAAEGRYRCVRLRGGKELFVLNYSIGGMLVEGPVRIAPGAVLEAYVVGPSGRALVRARALRSYVAVVEPECVRYQVALAFETPVTMA